jgi:Phytanoyl-CoA dioxygenase (PhyH)
MSAFELTLPHLEARNIVADCATIGTRIEAYRTREPSEHPKLIVKQQADAALQAQRCLPEMDAREFTSDRLRAAVAKHGALIVRNMFSRTSMETLIAAADRVIDACADPKATNPASAYFNPPNNLSSIMPKKDKELGNTRSFHRESGSAMCVEAPSVAEALLQLYEAHGLKELVGAYLGEPPCLSVKKWVLRRSKLPVAEAGWHQDGAFMGTNLNSINMWMPLNECGGETGAPGMDVVPLRLNSLASAEGAQFDWSVSDAQVSSRFTENQPLMPVFNAGDAFFFDHFYLHRTQYRTDFTRLRYAVETWFFGASSFPKNQIPLAW